MRAVLFLLRFTFICNLAFLLFVFFSRTEAVDPAKAGGDMLVGLPFVKGLIITLGFTAILVNGIMNIVCLFLLLSRRLRLLPRWLIITNFLFLLLQVYYFFILN